MSKNMCNLSCSPPAIERLSGGLFQEVIITNTILVKEKITKTLQLAWKWWKTHPRGYIVRGNLSHTTE